ncbi:MAG: hypothetical protein LBC38_05015 [Oscillospiraceae bacterium]|jgi:hypothetical protein|nr:hypothetical protein [Oscillospiraceae bacterium]
MKPENSDVMFMLEQLREKLQNSKKSLFSDDRYTVNSPELVDIIDDIIAAFPPQIAWAKDLLNQQTQYIEDKHREGDEIRAQAKRDAERMVSSSEIVRQAREKSREIAAVSTQKVYDLLGRAEARAEEIVRNAKTSTEDAFRKADTALSKARDDIRQAYQTFRVSENEPRH